jgi:hypothetical protein
MPRIKTILRHAAVYFLGSLVLVLGGFFALQFLFPELGDRAEVADEILFTELAREDLTENERQRLRVLIASAAPIPTDLSAIHSVLLRQAATRVQAASGTDAVEIVLAFSRDLRTAPPLARIVFAPDGKGWSGNADWTYQLKQPEPAFPENADKVLRVAADYLKITPIDDRSPEGIEDYILGKVSGFDSTSIRRILQPSYTDQRDPFK